jgi:site-specific recombinase XerD
MSDFEQLPLFERPPGEPASAVTDDEQGDAGLRPETPFKEALKVYFVALRLSGASQHTIKAFRSDLNLLGRWAGADRPVGEFGTDDLNKFLHWMLTERDRPCSPKTYARRVTTLKNFFSYLHETRAIPADPSTAVIQHPVSSPLPEVLSPAQIETVLKTTQSLRSDGPKPDVRPHFLVRLLLETAIKKGECMGLKRDDVDCASADEPILWIRYANPRMRYKERKIALKPDLLPVLDEYLQQRRPEGDVIFDCTARNLEYVLRDVSEAAGVAGSRLSFESLRWTCAVRDYAGGMKHEALRQKLGLSRISWRETSSKLEQLAANWGKQKAGEEPPPEITP